MEELNGRLKSKKRIIFRIWNYFIKTLKFIIIFIFLLASILVITSESEKIDSTIDKDLLTNESCNVSGIKLQGFLTTYIPLSHSDTFNEGNKSKEDETSSEDIIQKIQQAEKDNKIKAIILEIDSSGGYPVAGEEVANFMKNTTKPTVALIRQTGASAAYMAASGANKIFASKYSDVGSIGVTSSYLDHTKQNQNQGLNYISLSSGKFKDMGDPDKPITKEEKDIIMRDINISYQNFVKLIADNRNLDIEKVKKLADGSSMRGEMALQNGLIDQIGGISEVKDYLKGKIGEDINICW